MRILIAVNVDWFFISHRLPVALAAVIAGHDVHIMTQVTDCKHRLESYGFVVHNVNLDRSSGGPIGLIKLFLSYMRVFWTVRPDVVHLVTIKPVLIGGLAGRFSPVGGVVYAVSGLGHVFTESGLFGRLRRLVVKVGYRLILGAKNICVIFQNPTDRSAIESMVNLNPSKVAMIPGSGVDLTDYTFTPAPSGDITIIMAARLLRTKGVAEFVESARIIRKLNSKVRFLLVGAPDPANPATITDRELAAWKAEGVVEQLGHRSDIASLMQLAHIVVLPSYYGEGLPKVLIEAAACGRAVVTTDMPGCRDAIEPEVTGLLVAPRDAAALSNALLELVNDRGRCAEMGRAGRERAELLFDVNEVVKTHLNIYEALSKCT